MANTDMHFFGLWFLVCNFLELPLKNHLYSGPFFNLAIIRLNIQLQRLNSSIFVPFSICFSPVRNKKFHYTFWLLFRCNSKLGQNLFFFLHHVSFSCHFIARLGRTLFHLCRPVEFVFPSFILFLYSYSLFP